VKRIDSVILLEQIASLLTIFKKWENCYTFQNWHKDIKFLNEIVM